MTIIELKNIEKYFGSNCVIPTLNLEIRQGEFLTLLGPSGCGKTTLLRMIAGFETPTKGSVLLEGEDITSLPPYRRNVNTVFQNYALFPHLSVFDNVAFGLVQKGFSKNDIKNEVDNVLQMVQMNDFALRKPKELSGGQQQRIALARAIVNKPKVLLLDEPLAALDLKLRKQMQLELKILHEKLGITFIFVTHDQEEALTMSNRIAVMNKGVIEQMGKPQVVYDHPSTKFVANFVGENNTLQGFFDGKYLVKNHITIPVKAKNNQTGNAFLFIRPEHITIHQEAPQSDILENNSNFSIQATIIDTLFLGSQWRIHCQLETGEKMDVAIKPDQIAAIQGLKKIFINWDIEKATLAFE
jgi:spermidine/putrescine transport system ATP-binding protein